MKKYEITNETIQLYGGLKLHRIRAITDFGNIKKGQLGGYVESEENLVNDTENGTAWLHNDSWAYGESCVSGNAQIRDNVHIGGHATVKDNVLLFGNISVTGNACICDAAFLKGLMNISGNAKIKKDGDCVALQGFGEERSSVITCYKTSDNGIMIDSDFYHGTIDGLKEFAKHGRRSQAKKEYTKIASLLELYFEK